MIEAEELEFARAVAAKRPGMRAFIGRQKLYIAETVPVYGPDEGHWARLVTCIGGDHRERAAEFVRRYNRL